MGSLSPDRQGENLEILFFHPKNLFADGKNASDHSHSKRLKLQAVGYPKVLRRIRPGNEDAERAIAIRYASLDLERDGDEARRLTDARRGLSVLRLEAERRA
jgi:hypothetical protein